MFRIRRKKSKTYSDSPSNKQLAIRLTEDGVVEIDYNPERPPDVFFDTNVLLGLGASGINSLQHLQSKRGFRFRYSMVNFVELVSHLDDIPSEKIPNPFKRYQAPFKKMTRLFELSVLPSAEMLLMQATGLERFLDSKWVVDPMNIGRQVGIIANADSIEEVRKYGIEPSHYKHLKEIDGRSFVAMMKGGISTIQKPLKVTESSAKWLGHLYSFLIYRASSKRVRLATLKTSEQRRVITSFCRQGGKMFEGHLLKLLRRTIDDGRLPQGNDFYDMLQLLLLRLPNLLFVTDDRPFFSYYMGSDFHRVVPWKGFNASADL